MSDKIDKDNLESVSGGWDWPWSKKEVKEVEETLTISKKNSKGMDEVVKILDHDGVNTINSLVTPIFTSPIEGHNYTQVTIKIRYNKSSKKLISSSVLGMS